MKSHHLLSIASAALLAGLTAASAQAPRMDQAPAGNAAGPAEQKMPQNHAPSGATKSRAPEMTGQTSREVQPRAQRSETVPRGTTGEAAKSGTMHGGNDGTDAQGRPQRTGQSGQRTDENRPGVRSENRSTAQSGDKGSKDGESKGAATSGQGAAGTRSATSVQINQQQRTRIKQVINIRSAPKVAHVDFSLTVGTRVPHDRITLRPLPSRIVEIVPEYRGFLFFVVNDRIVIVDPDDYQIVVVIAA